MALVEAPVKTLNVTLQDRNNNKGTLTLYTPAAVVSEDAATFMTDTLIPQLELLSNATVVAWSIVQSARDDVTDNTDLASDVERKLSISFATNDLSTMSIEIPSVRQALVIKDTNVVDPANATVAAFVNMVLDTGLIDVYGLGNFRGASLVAVKTPPKQVHRRSSKG